MTWLSDRLCKLPKKWQTQLPNFSDRLSLQCIYSIWLSAVLGVNSQVLHKAYTDLWLLWRMFSSSSSALYGNCYTFNSLKSAAGPGQTSLLAGPGLGLSLVIALGQPFYMSNGLTTTAGVRVTIHDPLIRSDGTSHSILLVLSSRNNMEWCDSLQS